MQDKDLTKKREDIIMRRVKDLVPKKLSFLQRTQYQNDKPRVNPSLDKQSTNKVCSSYLYQNKNF